MEIGFIGLGKMGLNMTTRLVQGQHHIVAYDRNPKALKEAGKQGVITVTSLKDLVEKLSAPKSIWLMIPAGPPTEETIQQLIPLLKANDILIDGGNSFYKNSIKTASKLKSQGVHFLDVGVSGGIWGLKVGYCLMIGGAQEAFKTIEPVFATLASPDGYARVGMSGAGHFVKMVHNGIEYALLQAYSEGFEMMHAREDFDLDLRQIAHLWNQGSVVRSWLLELAENVFKEDPKLSSIEGYVEDSGEGRWTVFEAIDNNIPVPTITLALLERLRSRQTEVFSHRFIAALRNQFGGHAIKKLEE